MSHTLRVNKEATHRGKRLEHHCLHWHVRYAFQLVVNNELWDELGLRGKSARPICPDVERRPTKPNMYTNDVKVEMTNEYHPRCVS